MHVEVDMVAAQGARLGVSIDVHAVPDSTHKMKHKPQMSKTESLHRLVDSLAGSPRGRRTVVTRSDAYRIVNAALRIQECCSCKNRARVSGAQFTYLIPYSPLQSL